MIFTIKEYFVFLRANYIAIPNDHSNEKIQLTIIFHIN